MKNLAIMLLICLPLMTGCATALDLSQDVCEALVGGSKAGTLCDQIDTLRENEAPTEGELTSDV